MKLDGDLVPFLTLDQFLIRLERNQFEQKIILRSIKFQVKKLKKQAKRDARNESKKFEKMRKQALKGVKK